MSLTYKCSTTSVPWSIVGLSDSHYVSCGDTRRSVCAFSFMLNGPAISWLSKRQQSVACSTIEVEYMAVATTSRQGVWYLNAFIQLCYTIHITIMADNRSSINVAENPINNPETKHIDVAYHLSRQHLIRKFCSLSCVPSNDYIADLIRKVLHSIAHYGHAPCLRLLE